MNGQENEIMDLNEIIEMARQARLPYYYQDGAIVNLERLEVFAKLVAAKEREACANLCFKDKDDNAFVNKYNGKRLDLLCAELIRARGEA